MAAMTIAITAGLAFHPEGSLKPGLPYADSSGPTGREGAGAADTRTPSDGGPTRWSGSSGPGGLKASTLIHELRKKIDALRELPPIDGCPTAAATGESGSKCPPCAPLRPCLPPQNSAIATEDQMGAPCTTKSYSEHGTGILVRAWRLIFAWATWWHFTLMYIVCAAAYLLAAARGFVVESVLPLTVPSLVEPELKNSMLEKHREKALLAHQKKKGSKSKSLHRDQHTPSTRFYHRGKLSRRKGDHSHQVCAGSRRRPSTVPLDHSAGGDSASDTVVCYTVTVRTSDDKRAGAKARVLLTLHGHARISKEIELTHNPPGHRNGFRHPKSTMFEPGGADNFDIHTDDVGYIQAVSLRIRSHQGRSLAPQHHEWICGGVDVKAPDGNTFHFKCNAPISKRAPQVLPLTDTTANAPDVDMGTEVTLVSTTVAEPPMAHLQDNIDDLFDDVVDDLLDSDDLTESDAGTAPEGSTPRNLRFSLSRTEADVVEIKPITPITLTPL
mmetsp:Transcript_9856/g.29769  ORF Transcript_9856/g.29769 Transcript_9856/m.29769 type:complete len:499 (+) Transcript_9856:124-1620(+)